MKRTTYILIIAVSLLQINVYGQVWSQVHSFDGGERFKASGFSIGSIGYIGGGAQRITGAPVNYFDFWQYDTETDHWAPRAAVPDANPPFFPFSIGAYGYALTSNGFWEYDPVLDEWTPA